MNFREASYARHAEEFGHDLTDESRRKIAESWFDETTADYWRHSRAYECADCLESDRGASWLTVGDGRWGLDSIRIQKKGFPSVLATDISDSLLRGAKARGLIAEYAVENAERLSFRDEQYDYVFCKESLHHFPRPYVALYEMLRVARKAVFVVEPNDWCIARPRKIPFTKKLLFDVPLALINRLLGKPGYVRAYDEAPQRQPMESFEWEESGNFLYSFSRPEAEKVALGLNLPQLVIKGINDHYIAGCEFEPADPNRSDVFRKIIDTVNRLDAECHAGLHDYSLIMAGFFLKPMSPATREGFIKRGWAVLDLPRNPFLQHP